MTQIEVGTEKGAYLLSETAGGWEVEGPMFPGWKATAFGASPDGTHIAAVGSNWFGVGLHRSGDLRRWEPIERPPAWPEESGRKMEQIWTLLTVGDRIWAGVAQAGLFVSDDGGSSWEPVGGLNEHPTRAEWRPGFGGLCAHRVLADRQRVWVAISAVGCFRSDDGGATWTPKNVGVPPVDTAEGAAPPEVGYCIHGLAADPADADRMWRQDHRGVFRSTDAGDSWHRIENGLPSGFGFVIWRDPVSGRLLTIPLASDQNRVPQEGKLRVYKSDDDGDSWEVAGTGWSEAPQFTGVLRGAFDGDDQGTFCFGTTGGAVWLTRDTGDTWARLDPVFPRIGAVRVVS